MNVWPSRELYPQPARMPRRSGAPLAFMHIPKSGGTSLIKALDQTIIAEQRTGHHVRGFDASLFGGFNHFSQLRPSMRKIVRLSNLEYPTDTASILGHFAMSTLKTQAPGADLITFLREPAARLLSHWTYWRSLGWWNTRHWGPAWTSRIKQASRPLMEFLSATEIACQTDNLTTRMLLWPHPLIPADGFIDPVKHREILRLAQDRLRKFSYIDIIERGNVMTDEFVAWLGQNLPRLILNETAKTPRRHRTKLNRELNFETLDLLTRRTCLDDHLWSQIAQSRGISADRLSLLRETARLQAVARCSLLLN